MTGQRRGQLSRVRDSPVLRLGVLSQASVVRSDALKFTKLTNDEIEGHLTALAERDDDLGKAGE